MITSNIHPESAAIIEKYTGDQPPSSNEKLAEDELVDLAKVDRFGFYHPDGSNCDELNKEETQRLNRRLEKWRLMTRNFESEHSEWHRLFRNGSAVEKLKRRIFKGIPQQYRMIVWPLLLNIPQVKNDNKNLYSEMLSRALATSVHLEQIDKDIDRTFRNTTYFRARYGSRQQSLFRILAAYSVYNTEIGYCQGMSELVGLFLTYIVEEEDAFWALSQLMTGTKHKLHGVYTRDFPGLYRLFNHHEHVTKKLLPRISKHFLEQDLPTSTYAIKWFMQCFLDRLPVSLLLRLWDIYLLEGERILIAMAYNILKLHKKTLLRMDHDQLICFFQDELVKNFRFSDDNTIESLKSCLEQLHKFKLDRLPPPTANMLPTRSLGTFAPELVWQSKPLQSPKVKTQKNAVRSQPAISYVSNGVVDALQPPKKPLVGSTNSGSILNLHTKNVSSDSLVSVFPAASLSTRTKIIHPRSISPASAGSGLHPTTSMGDLRFPLNANMVIGKNRTGSPEVVSPPMLHTTAQLVGSTRYLHEHGRQNSCAKSDCGYSSADRRRRPQPQQVSIRSYDKSDVVLLSTRPRLDGIYEPYCEQLPTHTKPQPSDAGTLGHQKVLKPCTSVTSNDSSGFADRFLPFFSSMSSSTGPDDLNHPCLPHQASSRSQCTTPVSIPGSESSWLSGDILHAPSSTGSSATNRSSVAPKDSTLIPQDAHSTADPFPSPSNAVISAITSSEAMQLAHCFPTLCSISPEPKRVVDPRPVTFTLIPLSNSNSGAMAPSDRRNGKQSSPASPVFLNDVQMPPIKPVYVHAYHRPAPVLYPRQSERPSPP